MRRSGHCTTGGIGGAGRARGTAALLALLVLAAACGATATEGTPDPTDPTGSSASAEATDDTTAGPDTERTTDPTTAATATEATADSAAAPGDDLFPDVIDATATRQSDGTWTVEATLSSPYDTPQRYADAWRVVGPDGTVYGVRELLHDHANEQPFTRSQRGIEIPDDVDVVTVEGRDQVSGWGGATVELRLSR